MVKTRACLLRFSALRRILPIYRGTYLYYLYVNKPFQQFPFEQESRTARVLRKHFYVFPHLERRIYTYVSCLFLPAHSCHDRYSLSSNNCEPRAF